MPFFVRMFDLLHFRVQIGKINQLLICVRMDIDLKAVYNHY